MNSRGNYDCRLTGCPCLLNRLRISLACESRRFLTQTLYHIEGASANSDAGNASAFRLAPRLAPRSAPRGPPPTPRVRPRSPVPDFYHPFDTPAGEGGVGWKVGWKVGVGGVGLLRLFSAFRGPQRAWAGSPQPSALRALSARNPRYKPHRKRHCGGPLGVPVAPACGGEFKGSPPVASELPLGAACATYPPRHAAAEGLRGPG